jgi:hypothetical protein
MVLLNLDTKIFLFKNVALRVRIAKGWCKMIDDNVEKAKADLGKKMTDALK